MGLEQLKKKSAWGPLLTRVIIGVIFVVAGSMKLFVGMDGLVTTLTEINFPAAAFLMWVVAVTEFVGGIMLILGLYTRHAAIPLAAIMVVSTILQWSGELGAGGFMAAQLDLLLFASLVSLAFTGAGKWALKDE